MKQVEIVELKIGEFIPESKTLGLIYYSPQLKASSHLCLCGCGHNRLLLNKDVNNIEIIALKGCKSHYTVINGIANFV